MQISRYLFVACGVLVWWNSEITRHSNSLSSIARCFPRWLGSYGAPPRAISTKHNSVRLNPSFLPCPRLSTCFFLIFQCEIQIYMHDWGNNSATQKKTGAFMNGPPSFRCGPLHRSCKQLSVEAPVCRALPFPVKCRRKFRKNIFFWNSAISLSEKPFSPLKSFHGPHKREYLAHNCEKLCETVS